MKRIVVILLTLTTALITPQAIAANHVLSLDGDGDYVEIADKNFGKDTSFAVVR